MDIRERASQGKTRTEALAGERQGRKRERKRETDK